MQKVMFVASTGGHLNELMQLKSIFNNYDFNIMTEKTKSSLYLKEEYKGKVNYFIHGSKDHMLKYPFILCINTLYALIVFLISPIS